ncbi:MAG: fimbrillin family protein [Paramuribaculum sp.]|nr:fimbrillin family protein [Paramuribaculum sp.]
MPLKRLTGALLPIALVAAGCTSTDGPLPDDQPSALRMEFTACESGGSRALTTADNLTEQPFAVWSTCINTLLPKDYHTVFDATEVAFSTENNAWGYADAQYWLPGFTYSFAALHPAATEGAKVKFEEGRMTLDYTISTDAAKRVDLLHAVAVKECGDYVDDPTLLPGPVTLQFSHILCQVHFLLRVDPAVKGNVIVNSAKLWGIDRRAIFEQAPSSADYHWVNMPDRGEAMPTTSDAPYVERTEPLTIASGEKHHLFQIGESRLLIIPQYVGTDATLEVEYTMPDGTRRKATADVWQAAANHDGRWLIGKNFSYTLVVGADEYIIFDKPVISDWQLSEGGNYIIQDK